MTEANPNLVLAAKVLAMVDAAVRLKADYPDLSGAIEVLAQEAGECIAGMRPDHVETFLRAVKGLLALVDQIEKQKPPTSDNISQSRDVSALVTALATQMEMTRKRPERDD